MTDQSWPICSKSTHIQSKAAIAAISATCASFKLTLKQLAMSPDRNLFSTLLFLIFQNVFNRQSDWLCVLNETTALHKQPCSMQLIEISVLDLPVHRAKRRPHKSQSHRSHNYTGSKTRNPLQDNVYPQSYPG